MMLDKYADLCFREIARSVQCLSYDMDLVDPYIGLLMTLPSPQCRERWMIMGFVMSLGDLHIGPLSLSYDGSTRSHYGGSTAEVCVLRGLISSSVGGAFVLLS